MVASSGLLRSYNRGQLLFRGCVVLIAVLATHHFIKAAYFPSTTALGTPTTLLQKSQIAKGVATAATTVSPTNSILADLTRQIKDVLRVMPTSIGAGVGDQQQTEINRNDANHAKDANKKADGWTRDIVSEQKSDAFVNRDKNVDTARHRASQAQFGWDPLHHVKLLEGKPVIWAFWNSRFTKTMPAYILLSLLTIYCHNYHEFHLQLVDDDQMPALVRNVHPSYWMMTPNHKSDYFRPRVLHEYGGIYVDADTIGWSSLKPVHDHLINFDVSGISWRPNADLLAVTTVGPIRANTSFTNAVLPIIDNFLDSKLQILRDFTDRPGNKTYEKHPGKGDLYAYPLHFGDIYGRWAKKTAHSVNRKGVFKFKEYPGPSTWGQMAYGNGPSFRNLYRPVYPSFRLKGVEIYMYFDANGKDPYEKLNIRQVMAKNAVMSELFRWSFNRCRPYFDADKAADVTPPPPIDISFAKPADGHKLNNPDSELTDWVLKLAEKFRLDQIRF